MSIENKISKVSERFEELEVKIIKLLGLNTSEAAENAEILCEVLDATMVPHLNEVVGFINVVVSSVNRKKLYGAWKCIARDENIEESINQLYNYIDNEERAFYVAECLKKIAWSNSKIAASIIGFMLGEIKTQTRDFCNDDLLLLNALEHMTDFDIRNFKELMEGNYIKSDIGKEYFHTAQFPKEKMGEYYSILEFGEKYRLFSVSAGAFTDDNDALFIGEVEYAPKKVSKKLLGYINRVKQIINYNI